MEPVSFFSGVVSGFDWRQLVEQVMTLERRPVTRLEDQILEIDAKTSSFQQYRTLISTFHQTAIDLRSGAAFDGVATTTTGQTSAGVPILSASADEGTPPGSYQVEVLALARAEKLGGDQFADDTTALNLTGDFFVNGVRISVTAADSLISIRDKINDANAGDDPIEVTASVLSAGTDSHRLMLTSDAEGAAGINLIDGPDGILTQLGFVDATTTIKHATSAGGESDRFTDRTTAIATLLGLGSAVGAQNVTIGGQSVSLDLDNDTLDDLAVKIDGLTGISASVQTETAPDGTNRYYLDIAGTTAFTDAGSALELLGVVELGRGSVAQSVQGAVLTDGDASTPATAASQLVNLFSGGQAAGVQTGDTLTINGTRGDGTAVSLTYTVGAGDTVQDVLDHLNNATDGFGAGARTATASVNAAGRIVVTDDTAGDSQLSLSIVANNEGGGTLDLGTFDVATLGRSREIVSGTDAVLRVDGVTLTRTSNVLTDVLSGVKLTLHAAEAGSFATVTVARSAETALATAQSFVDQYNEIVSFTKAQLIVEPDAIDLPPLHGDATLRLARRTLVTELLAEVENVASDLATLNAVGIELDAEGTLSLNTTTFQDAFTNRFADLERLFMERGSANDAEVTFVSSAGTAAAGVYDVEITTAATQAAVLGAGFSGTYTDDATADTLSITEAGSGFVGSVALTNGMTTQQIVDALNLEFDRTAQHKLATANTLYSDAAATVEITEATTLDSLFAADQTPAAVAAGDTIDFVLTTDGGIGTSATFTVADPATETVGDVMAALRDAFGDGVTVSVESGTIVVEAEDAGNSPIALTVTANNEGGGTLDVGAAGVAVAGRLSMEMVATAVGNEVQITHDGYGSTPGFTVALTGGGTDNTAQLGIAASTYNGLDVAGTIGGHAATGSGQSLVGDEDTPVDGLQVSYVGNTARSAGQVTLTLGTGATLERQLDILLEAGTGTFDLKEQGFVDQISRLESNIERMEARLERRRLTLVQRFLAMEVLVGQLQAQSAALGSSISTLFNPNQGN